MSPSAARSHNRQNSFRGPTSAAFNFGVAKSSLQTMGITPQNDEQEDESDGAGLTREPSPSVRNILRIRNGEQVSQDFHVNKDPIWTIPQEEALRLCHVYEDEMGLMYPVLNISIVIAHAQGLYRFMEAAHRTGLMQKGLPGADSIEDVNTNILKLVLATAMTVEASGRSDLGRRVFEYVQPAIDNLLLGSVGVEGIRLLTMAVWRPL